MIFKRGKKDSVKFLGDAISVPMETPFQGSLNICSVSFGKYFHRPLSLQNRKKGLSPIIATVLLVVLVIIISGIIFLWVKSFIGEAVVKNGASADQRCGEINLEASRVSSTLYLNNRGNVPVYSIEVKLGSAGREEVVRKDKINLAPGQANTYEISGMESAETVNIVPSVLGETKTLKKEYTCTKINVEVEGE